MAVMNLKAPIILYFHVVLFTNLLFLNGYIDGKSTSTASTTKFIEISTTPNIFNEYFVISSTIIFKQHIAICHFGLSQKVFFYGKDKALSELCINVLA